MNDRKNGRREAALWFLLIVLCILILNGSWLLEKADEAISMQHRKLHAEEPVVIEDMRGFAKDAAYKYRLENYTRYAYDGDHLVGEYRYDAGGQLTDQTLWEYDTDGNILCENVRQNSDVFSPGESRTVSSYDDRGRVVNERMYEKGVLKNECFYRYMEDASVCVTYQYFVEKTEQGTYERFVNFHSETVYNREGKEVYQCNYYGRDDVLENVIRTTYDEKGRQINRLEGNDQEDVQWAWRYDWVELEDGQWESTIWKNGEKERVERYIDCPDTDTMYMTGLLDRDQWGNVSHLYEAAYDKERLLWELDCTLGKLEYFRAFCYHENGETDRMLLCNKSGVWLYYYHYDEAGRLIGRYCYNSFESEYPYGQGDRGGTVDVETEMSDGDQFLYLSGIVLHGPGGERIFAFDEAGRCLGADQEETGTGADQEE